jgi:hypothetical protein
LRAREVVSAPSRRASATRFAVPCRGTDYGNASTGCTAVAAEYSILSSADSHARKDWRTIVTRKSADIVQAKYSVWVLNSNAARPDAVQSFCNKHGARRVIFLSRERDIKPTSRPTTENGARGYSPAGGCELLDVAAVARRRGRRGVLKRSRSASHWSAHRQD